VIDPGKFYIEVFFQKSGGAFQHISGGGDLFIFKYHPENPVFKRNHLHRHPAESSGQRAIQRQKFTLTIARMLNISHCRFADTIDPRRSFPGGTTGDKQQQ
jgi:hypothetical protein